MPSTAPNQDRVRVVAAADSLRAAAAVARTATDQIDTARTRLIAVVRSAARSGFDVDDDLTIWDTRPVSTAAERTSRDALGLRFAGDVQARAAELMSIDRDVASRLTASAAGFQGLTFPEAPAPGEPPPPPVPMAHYEPKVWGACKLSGADPGKFVRTFNRAPITAGFRTLPGGDSQLYCGNDKYGFLHIANRHGADWERKGGPWGGNWRYLADYCIAATLAYPETVTYKQDNDTFILERAIYPTDGDGNVIGPAAWKSRVVISATDGKIITAYPVNVKPQ